ncbi:MAG: CoA ester lyase [Anaerolineae bacterium]|nr:MAG: CoA ester lyase [Anaerolineae bacterium]
MTHRPRRALLYMPATDWRKIEKAATELVVDSVCVDLEDGVALNRKEEARVSAVKALQSLDFGPRERLVRINPVGSGLEADDLKTVVPARPDGIVVPKVNDADEIRWVSKTVRRLQSEHGLPSIGLIAIVESARGIVNLREIAGADARLEALIFGAEDFASDIGAVRTEAAMEVFYARSAVATHAAAFDLQAIDLVRTDYKDMDALARESRQGLEMGFSGKQTIHPAQVPVVQAAFTPTAEDVAWARKVVDAHTEHQKKGTGAFAIDGKMIDMPVVKAAERVLARVGR